MGMHHGEGQHTVVGQFKLNRKTRNILDSPPPSPEPPEKTRAIKWSLSSLLSSLTNSCSILAPLSCYKGGAALHLEVGVAILALFLLFLLLPSWESHIINTLSLSCIFNSSSQEVSHWFLSKLKSLLLKTKTLIGSSFQLSPTSLLTSCLHVLAP